MSPDERLVVFGKARAERLSSRPRAETDGSFLSLPDAGEGNIDKGFIKEVIDLLLTPFWLDRTVWPSLNHKRTCFRCVGDQRQVLFIHFPTHPLSSACPPAPSFPFSLTRSYFLSRYEADSVSAVLLTLAQLLHPRQCAAQPNVDQTPHIPTHM